MLDDLAMAPMSNPARRDLLEVLDDRQGSHATIVTSQILRARFRKICNALINYAAIGDPTLADTIPDRLVRNAHRLTLADKSMHKRRNGLTSKEVSE